jgi:cell division septation protein DedD
MADEGFHEIQLSGKHLVALFMAATVVAVVIFLCGVMVGRNINAQRLALAEAASAAPIDPTAEVRPSEPPPPPPSTAASSGSAASRETLSYPDRLSGNAPASESLKPAPREAAPAPAPAPPPPPAAEDPVEPAAATSGATAAREPAGSGFAVQVAAVRERSEADTIARRLSSKGYSAYVMAPARGTPRVFRVRVGKFKDRREAEQVAGRLAKEEQFKPWITR